MADHLDITLETTSSASGLSLAALVGLALRRNPRRAHLLVSKVLGKHVPADPRLVLGVGRTLGLLVADALTAGSVDHAGLLGVREGLVAAIRGGPEPAVQLLARSYACPVATLAEESPLVLGFAETATGLGHAVADALRAPYLHSTRRPVPGVEQQQSFREEHSHAAEHLLLAADPGMLLGSGPLVLVDDELSTGHTALNAIAALQARAPRRRYVIAALVDLRDPGDRAIMTRQARQLGTSIEVVSLAAGRISLPADVLSRAERIVGGREGSVPVDPPPVLPAAVVHQVARRWPTGVPDGGRHGFSRTDEAAMSLAVQVMAGEVEPALIGRDVLVLGFEELMYAPLRIAVDLADRLERSVGPDARIRFSSTTRSPVLAVDDPGYAVRTRLVFPSHDHPADGPGPRYAYNVRPGEGATGFSDIVLVLDDEAETPELFGTDGLVTQLAACCSRVHLLVIPSHRPTPVVSWSGTGAGAGRGSGRSTR